MRAADASIAVIDFEGTGAVDGLPNEPWQVAVVRVERGGVDPASAWESLVRVGPRPFSPHAPGRHAERRAEIAAAPAMADLWPALRRALAGDARTAHHAATERAFLNRAAPFHRFAPWIDTLKLVRHAWPDLASHALEDVTERLGLAGAVRALAPGRAPHDARYDAFACARLLQHLLEQPGWGDATVATLAAARASAFHRRAARRDAGPRPAPRRDGLPYP